MITHYDIHAIILIGYTDEVGKPQFRHNIELFRGREDINCQAYETWKLCRKEFEDDIQLVWLFKGLVILERELKWIGGSVAGAIWVYRMIQEANLDKEFQIADFGFRNCDNPWVPFGNSYYGKRTITDYFAYRSETSKVSAIKYDRYTKVLKRVEGRKEKRISAIAELRKLNKEQRGTIRTELSEQYKNATNVEKLETIANDKIFPPEYYPTEWIKLSVEEIEKLPIDLIKKLYDKLSTKTKGEWKRFAQELQKLDDGI